jgi:hypothetical protein
LLSLFFYPQKKFTTADGVVSDFEALHSFTDRFHNASDFGTGRKFSFGL